MALVVTDSSRRTVGVAPWHIENSLAWGRVVRFLGSGEVCSDYLSLLAKPEHMARVVTAIADYVMGEARDDWDIIDLGPIDLQDTAIAQLVTQLEERGRCCIAATGRMFGGSQLPETWAQYEADLVEIAPQAGPPARQARVETDRATLHTATTPNELDAAWRVLIDLHQRRRKRSASRAASPRHDSRRFIAASRGGCSRPGMLRLHWLTLDGGRSPPNITSPGPTPFSPISPASTRAARGGAGPADHDRPVAESDHRRLPQIRLLPRRRAVQSPFPRGATTDGAVAGRFAAGVRSAAASGVVGGMENEARVTREF